MYADLDGLGWDVQRTVKAAHRLAALLKEVKKHGKKKKEEEEENSDDTDSDQEEEEDTDQKEGDSGNGEGESDKWMPFKRRRLMPGKGGDTWEDFEPWMKPTRHTPKWTTPIDKVYMDHYASFANMNWMEMEILRPQLVKPKWAKGVGCTDAGDVFRAPHRLTCDQKVFRMNRAKRAGSLLIDASGSMSLSPAAIKNIVMSVPAAVIAYYCGPSSHKGVLKILAKYGLLVKNDTEFASMGDSNGVDGPALRWLALQPRPRIWISDGYVTGISDNLGKNLVEETNDICDRARIVRVNTLDEARRLL